MSLATVASGSRQVHVEHGDCRDVICSIPDCSIDACVTDPPYSLVSIQKRFGKPGSAPAKDRDGLYKRASAGFRGKQWDTGEVAHDPAFWAEVFRVLKPGAHLVAFAGTRTYHRMACAIEDAGWEIRDQLAWAYASGFPKSHDVAKALDKRGGYWRGRRGPAVEGGTTAMGTNYERTPKGFPVLEEAQRWEGWGTALKPAWEPICLARKPLVGTVVENVLQHGTGAVHIDACRVGYASEDDAAAAAAAAEQRSRQTGRSFDGWGMKSQDLTATDYLNGPAGKGRWPANLIHDGSEEVLEAFAAFGKRPSRPGTSCSEGGGANVYVGGWNSNREPSSYVAKNDTGSAARFFFSAKADADDRWGSKHPTVKPVDLVRWLARLVTPPGGTVLDPFAGSGTTGIACLAEGFDCILIEREDEYLADINARLDHYRGEGKHSLQAKNRNAKPGDLGPLFGGETP